MHLSGTFGNALKSVDNNPTTMIDKERQALFFIDEEVLRGSALRNDYEFPYLHQFMRLRSSTLSVWPQEITHVRPR